MSAPRFFSLDYIERAVLQDGTKVVVRLIRPEDRDILRTGFERLSPESRYARFLAPKQALSDDELRYLCEVDHETHVAIGAVRDDSPDAAVDAAPDSTEMPSPGASEASEAGDAAPVAVADPATPVGLAIARFIRLADPPNTAEAAIAVADEAQHQGLGRLLFMRLVAAAAERGIERFRCEILGSNAAMAALLAQISPDRTIEAGAGMMLIEIALPNVAPTQPPAGAPVQSPMYRLFRAVAGNAVEWTGAVRNLWRR